MTIAIPIPQLSHGVTAVETARQELAFSAGRTSGVSIAPVDAWGR
jgi:hypothetical protein